MTSEAAAVALSGGAVTGAFFVALSYSIPRHARQIVVAALLVTAMLYVGFALTAGAGPAWLTVELVGVLLYGGAALRGLRGSSWWVAAGWGLHPIWDVAHHVARTDHAFVPTWYAAACLGFDFTVAAVIASRTLRVAATALPE